MVNAGEGGEDGKGLTAAAVVPDVSSSEDEGVNASNRWGDSGMSDFDVMLARKKEDQTRRRKRKDIDIINDNDDLIEGLLIEMKNAADVSFPFYVTISCLLCLSRFMFRSCGVIV